MWIEEGDAPTASGIMLNTYVRVIGAIRQQGEIKMIMIYKIAAVQGINEVNTHYLEVINARFQAEDYYRGGSGASEVVKMETNGYPSVKQDQLSSQEGPQGKSSIIFNAIRADGERAPETGVSRQDLARKFPQINGNELTKIIDQLISEGHVYSTVDNDHFLACC